MRPPITSVTSFGATGKAGLIGAYRQLMVNFFDGKPRPTHFITVTYASERHQDRAEKSLKFGMRTLARGLGAHIPAVYATEAQERGHWHHHVLAGLPGPFTPDPGKIHERARGLARTLLKRVGRKPTKDRLAEITPLIEQEILDAFKQLVASGVGRLWRHGDTRAGDIQVVLMDASIPMSRSFPHYLAVKAARGESWNMNYFCPRLDGRCKRTTCIVAGEPLRA